MKKKCIFCGKEPKNTTKEHIIPQWLIKETGDPNRKALFGINKKNQEHIIFNFNSFVFPACEECNNEYSQLENKVKSIIIKNVE